MVNLLIVSVQVIRQGGGRRPTQPCLSTGLVQAHLHADYLDVWSWMVAQHCSRCFKPDPRMVGPAQASRPSHLPRPRPLRSVVAQPSRRAAQLGSGDGAIAAMCPDARAAGSSRQIDHLYIGSDLPCAGELAPRPLEAVLRVVMRALVQACHCVNVTVTKRSRVPLCLRVTASGRQRP